MAGNRKLFSSYKAYNGDNVIFGSNLRDNIIGKVHEITKAGKVIGRGRKAYVMRLGNKPKDKICLATIDENSTLWHRRLGHTNMRLIQSLTSKELVKNLPKFKFDQHFCDACKIGKQAHGSHRAKNIVSTTRCLELLHIDLFNPSAVQSYRGKCCTLVIVDDYSSDIDWGTNVPVESNIHDNVIKLRHELDEVQKSLDRDPSNVELRDEEAAYLKAFQDAIIDEERFLFQKAKIDWLKLVDANTAYFHKVVKSQALRNRIDSITNMDGNIVDAPGPDGFSAAFFKETWDIILDDVCKAIKEFFTN
nr:RNA-directed DNA polymerase, eukaryota, reverse transcriptase zinc-binding domain protein [Tanacetum cinerariifolium]